MKALFFDSDTSRIVISGVPMDEADVSLRACLSRLTDGHLAECDPAWTDEQVTAWDGNFKSDGTLMLDCCAPRHSTLKQRRASLLRPAANCPGFLASVLTLLFSARRVEIALAVPETAARNFSRRYQRLRNRPRAARNRTGGRRSPRSAAYLRTVQTAEAPTFPAASYAKAWSVCWPRGSLLVFQINSGDADVLVA